jgi:phenylalanyl-tRNA synthetase beta chain
MKISYNWLKEFIDTDKSAEEISTILTGVGLEVEVLDKVQAIPGGLEGLVIGHVKESSDHPNSDHLHVTKVDVGTGQDLQIVCGATNVAALARCFTPWKATALRSTNQKYVARFPKG